MGDIYTNPPQSRNEAILRATIDGTEYTDPPQSRIEDLLLELKEAIEEGGGSVESYEQLTNKPQINGTTLSGNKTTEDLIPIGDGLHINADGELETADAYIPTSEKGTASGVATLTEAGKVPEAQLPSYVDDAIEGYLYEGHFYADSAHTEEITGERGKIYVDLDTNRAYRWTGSTFVEIGDNNTFTANRALVSDANGKVSASSATSEEVGYLSGVTGAIQTQIDGKADESEATPVSVSGNPITITDAANIPCESLSMTIEPIQSGSGTPSPTNVRPITGLTEAKADRIGKNLFDSTKQVNPNFTDDIARIISIYNTDGVYAIGYLSGANATMASNSNYATCVLPVEAGETYTIADSPSNFSNVIFTDENGVIKSKSNTWISTFTHTVSNDEKYMLFSLDKTHFGYVQVERGTTATAYEPYKHEQATITFGETVYGGNVDFDSGIVTVTHKHDKMEESDLSNVYTVTNGVFRVSYSSGGKQNNFDVVCNKLPSSNTSQGIFLSNTGDIIINCLGQDKNGMYATYGDLDYVYPLATPRTLTLTPAQLTLLKGYNTVYANGATISLDYQKDNLAGDIKKWVIEHFG